MIFEVYGIPSGEDDVTYQQDIPLLLEDLKVIMGWKEDRECAGDYWLTAQQISDIQKKCSFELPVDLDLYLSNHQ